MPGGFQASFQANGYQHQSIYKHAIYANVIEKLKDGQQLFIDDAAIKKQFTFSKLIAVNMDEGSASLRGRIVNNFKLPVQRASIIPADQKYFAITDAKGNVVSTVLPKAPIYLLLHACWGGNFLYCRHSQQGQYQPFKW